MSFSGDLSLRLWKAYVEDGKATFNPGPLMTTWSLSITLLYQQLPKKKKKAFYFILVITFLHLFITEV